MAYPTFHRDKGCWPSQVGTAQLWDDAPTNGATWPAIIAQLCRDCSFYPCETRLVLACSGGNASGPLPIQPFLQLLWELLLQGSKQEMAPVPSRLRNPNSKGLKSRAPSLRPTAPPSPNQRTVMGQGQGGRGKGRSQAAFPSESHQPSKQEPHLNPVE